MQINPQAATPAHLHTAAEMLANVQAKPDKSGVAKVVDMVSLGTTPFELYTTGRAAFGHGTAGPVPQALAGAHVALGLYKSGQALFTKVTPEALNEAIKPQNGGRDLAPADARFLADNINKRNHIHASIAMGNYVACGAALATGNMAAGLVGLGMKVAATGYQMYSTAAMLKDVMEVLSHQPAPPAPAPSPAPAP